MRFSVALCTYNGAKYLERQLASIAAQSRMPDELVVCDDRSSDATVDILEAFARQAAFPVHIHVNLVNLGSTQNFEQAIRRCTGDWIALSDQDDAWAPTKLARFAEAIASGADVGLVICDGWLCGPDLQRTALRAWPNIPFTTAMQTRFNRGDGPRLMLRYNVVTGAGAAFRADLRDIVLPIPPSWVHDGWIGFLAAAVADARALPDPLFDYRQHASQQIGIQKLSLWRQIRTAYYRLDRPYFDLLTEGFEALAARLGQFPGRLRDSELLTWANDKARHCAVRRDMRGSPRWRRVVDATRELAAGRYHRFGLGLKAFAVDVLMR